MEGESWGSMMQHTALQAGIGGASSGEEWMGPTRPGRRLSHAARGDECDVMTKKYGRGSSGRMRQPAGGGFHKNYIND